MRYINKQQKQELSKIAKKYKLKLIMLFGSFVNGTNRQRSDFDVAVLGKDKNIIQKDIELINALTKILQKNVDLSIVYNANPLLLEQVSKNAVLLYGSKIDFFNFKLRAFHRYNDYAPYFKMEYEFIKKRVNYLVEKYAC